MEKKPKQEFSLQARKQSIRFAIDGVLSFFKAEHNAIIQLFFTIAVIVMAIVLKVNGSEAGILALAIGGVWVSEIFNTSIEAMMNYLSPGQHPSVKVIKDISAAAVLFAALTAVVVGLLIFIPKLF